MTLVWFSMSLEEREDLVDQFVKDIPKMLSMQMREELIISIVKKYSGISEYGVYTPIKNKGIASKDTIISDIDRMVKISKKLIRKKDNRRNNITNHLYVNDRNWFTRLNEQIDNMMIHNRQQHSQYHQYPEARERNLRITHWNLARIHRHIKNEIDKQYLNQKIIDLLLEINYNKKGLASEIDNEVMY